MYYLKYCKKNNFKMKILLFFLLFFLVSCGQDDLENIDINDKDDNISFKNYGNALKSISVYTGDYFYHEGIEYYYGVTSSEEGAKIFRFNLDSKEIDWTFLIPNIDGSWGINKNGNNLYIAGYNPAELYKIDLDTNELDLIFTAEGEQMIFSMNSNSDALYFGTYPNSKLFAYNIITGDINEFGSISSQSHIKSLEFIGNKLYAGTGSEAELIEIDVVTGDFKNILPRSFSKDSFVFSLKNIDDNLFIGLSPSYDVLKFDPKIRKFEKMLVDSKLGQAFSVPSFNENTHHFSGIEGIIYEYNSKNNTLLRLVEPIKSPNYWVTGSRIIDNNKIAGVLSTGTYFEMDFDGTSIMNVSFSDVGLRGEAVRPYSVSSNDGWIYIAENSIRYLNLKNGIDQNVAIAGQAKLLGIGQNNIFTANYGGAYVWNLPAGNNINFLENLDFRDPNLLITKISEGQNRPLSIDFNPFTSVLLIGTEPDYGKFGGSLFIYNEISNKYITIDNVINNHSISAVKSDIDAYYIGSSIWGGTGGLPLNESPYIVKIDPITNDLIWEQEIDKSERIYNLETFSDSLFAIVDDWKIIELSKEDGSFISAYSLNNPQYILKTSDNEIFVLGNKELYKWDIENQNFEVVYSGFHDAYLISWDNIDQKIVVVDGVNLLISE